MNRKYGAGKWMLLFLKNVLENKIVAVVTFLDK